MIFPIRKINLIKQAIVLTVSLFLAYTVSAQVGIGTLTPDSSSILELETTTKGFLMPRLTTSQRDSIINPTVGLQLFNLDDQCIDLFDGTHWIKTCGWKQVGVGDSIGTNHWIPKGNGGAPSVRRKAFSFTINNKVYVGTGQDGSSNYEDFWEYNPATNVWTQKANLPGGVRYGAVGFAIGSKGYAGLGDNFGAYKIDFYEYDPVTNVWTAKANYGGAARREAVGFAIDGKGYVGTGFNGTTNFQDMWEYNPVANGWSSKANFPGAGRSSAISFVIGTDGYVGTGFNGSYLADFYKYDQVNNSWSAIANFGGGTRRNAVAFSLGSMGYAGTGLTVSNIATQDFWQYDPITNSWVLKTPFSGVARYGAVGFAIGGKGYIGSGSQMSGINVNDFWQYRPSVEAPIYSNPTPNGGYAGVVDGMWTRNGYAMHSTSARYVGIGITTPDTNAILDIKSTSKGLLIPRLNSFQRQAIISPPEGLLVYDYGDNQFYYYLNQDWITFLGNKVGVDANSENVAVGDSALANVSSIGNGNTAIGSNALYANSDGSFNVSIGPKALNANATGSYNTAIGSSSLEANTTGFYNIAIGRYALKSNISGGHNIALGNEALKLNLAGDGNIALGNSALYKNTFGYDNVGIGIRALEDNLTGDNNTSIGSFSMGENTIGSENVGVGYQALSSNVSGNYNVGVGVSALRDNTTGTRNTAVGNTSLLKNTTGVNNTAVGDSSLYNTATGDGNSGLGRQALLALTSGDNNTGIGSSSSSFITTGTQNTAVGRNCLDNIVTGNNNTALGNGADVSGSGGAFTNATAIGYNATATASNYIKIGNGSVTVIGGAVDWSIISDGRFKKDVHDNVPGLAFISRLRPVTYHLDVNSIAEHLKEDYERDEAGQLVYVTPDQATIEARNQKSEILNTGFIAQEVEAAAKSIDYDFYGVNAPTNNDDHYSLSYASFTVPLVKAVQELSQENQNLKSTLILQSQLLEQFKNELEALKAEIVQIKVQLQN